MPKVRNITVAVSPELYRQSRHIAAECDTSVTELVRFILTNLPNLLRRANHPAADWTGIPKRPSPSSAASTVPAPTTVPAPPAVPMPAPHPVASAIPAPPPPASGPAAPAPQQSAYRSRWAAARASRAASPARSRAALLREAQRLLNS